MTMSREAGKHCSVAYFDVGKAFDSLWINGLFYQLYNLGVIGILENLEKSIFRF